MRPEVKIIQTQTEDITPLEISNSEAEMLLGKYGYLNNQPIVNKDQNDLSFEEMVTREEEKRRNDILKIKGPKPITFGGKYYSETKYDSDSESNLNFKVNIVSDMKLPNY